MQNLVGFEEFWAKYPRHIKKVSARKAWEKVNPQNGQVEQILAAVEAQKANNWLGEDLYFIPHASTWLNQKRWEDEIEAPRQKKNVCVPCARPEFTPEEIAEMERDIARMKGLK